MNRPEDASARFARQNSIPRNSEGPVFGAPWQAQAFAMAVALHEAGCFTWTQWSQALGAEIASAGSGKDDDGEAYYRHWLTALEKLAAQTSLVSEDELRERKAAWDRAARATPHGQPIALGRDETVKAGIPPASRSNP